MPSYEFECKKCKCAFEIFSEDDDTSEVVCIDCNSTELSIIGFYDGVERALFELAKQIEGLERRLQIIEDGFEDGGD